MFRFYITDLFDGIIRGTDNQKSAEDYAHSEDFYVVDTETGEWIQPDNSRVQIEEIK